MGWHVICTLMGCGTSRDVSPSSSRHWWNTHVVWNSSCHLFKSKPKAGLLILYALLLIPLKWCFFIHLGCLTPDGKTDWLSPSDCTSHSPLPGPMSLSCLATGARDAKTASEGWALHLDWLWPPTILPGWDVRGQGRGTLGVIWEQAYLPTAAATQWRKDSTVLFSLSVFINILNMKHFSFLHSDGWLYVYEMFSFIWRQGNQNQLKLSHWRERKQVGVGQPGFRPSCFSRVVAGRRARFSRNMLFSW